jgi:cysteine desulfurase
MKAFRKRVYLDWASSAPVLPEAKRVFVEALQVFGNPSSPHEEGERARVLLEESRTTIARIAGIKPEGVIFTSGATEANTLAIQGVITSAMKNNTKEHFEKIPQKVDKIHVLYLPTAHASVMENMEALRKLGVSVEQLVITNGGVDLEVLKKQLREETALVSMDSVCGETGTKWDTRDVRRVLNAAQSKNKNKIVLHVDASQAPLTESIDCGHLGADLLTLDAQKVGGFRGMGALLRANAYTTPLKPIMYGGGQEQGLRPGTENPALAAAFALAIKSAQEGREAFNSRARSARETLLANGIPEVLVNVGKEFSPHILNISLPGRDTDYAVMLLSQAGFAVSTKSACETNEVGSRVVLALFADEARAASTLRISWGPSTSDRELRAFAKELIRVLKFLDTHSLP